MSFEGSWFLEFISDQNAYSGGLELKLDSQVGLIQMQCSLKQLERICKPKCRSLHHVLQSNTDVSVTAVRSEKSTACYCHPEQCCMLAQAIVGGIVGGVVGAGIILLIAGLLWRRHAKQAEPGHKLLSTHTNSSFYTHSTMPDWNPPTVSSGLICAVL